MRKDTIIHKIDSILYSTSEAMDEIEQHRNELFKMKSLVDKPGFKITADFIEELEYLEATYEVSDYGDE